MQAAEDASILPHQRYRLVIDAGEQVALVIQLKFGACHFRPPAVSPEQDVRGAPHRSEFYDRVSRGACRIFTTKAAPLYQQNVHGTGLPCRVSTVSIKARFVLF